MAERTVITVTLNPCIDRTLWVDELSPGALHRIKKSATDVSGKGINVSLALHQWGHPSLALGILAGETGKRIEAALRQKGIEAEFTYVPGESRTNTKVIEIPSGRLTELNEAGAPVGDGDLTDVARSLDGRVNEAPFVVLSGSLPPGAPATTYADLTRRFKSRTGVVLDSGGRSLQEGVASCPALVKPNRLEMEELLGTPLGGIDSWCTAVERVRRMGVARVVLSLGGDGAVFAADDGLLWAKSRPIHVKSPVGCGDTLLAGTLYGLAWGWPWPDCARFAVAAATAAAEREGTVFPSRAQVDMALAGVTVEQIG